MSGACIHDKENIKNAFNEENSQGIQFSHLRTIWVC